MLEPLEDRRLLAFNVLTDMAAITGTLYYNLLPGNVEKPLENQPVELFKDSGLNGGGAILNAFDPTDTLEDTQWTDVDGKFRFDSLGVGTYFVRQPAEPSGKITPTPERLVRTVFVTIDDANGEEGFLVDHFEDRQSLTAQLSGTPKVSSGISAPTALGGHRKVIVEALSGSGKVNVEVNEAGDSLFSYSENASTTGYAITTWDGTDDDPLSVVMDGLGGIDFTGGGVQDSLVLDIQSSQTPARQTFTVYTDATHASWVTADVPGFTFDKEQVIKFSEFQQHPNFPFPADFSNVGAFSFDIRKVPGFEPFALDYDMHRISTVGPKVLDVTLPFEVNSEIQLVKLTNGTDNNAPTGPVVPVGSTVTWTYEVTNPGNEWISGVDVQDDQFGVTPTPVLVGPYNIGDINQNDYLEPGEEWLFTATGIAIEGQYENLGTATGTGAVSEEPLTDTDLDHYFGATPGVNILKLTNGTDNNSPTGPVVAVGSTVTFTYIVTNTGNVPLADVDVTDDQGVIVSGPAPGGDADGDGLLDVDETWTYTASTLAVADQYVNNGTVVGTPVTESGDPIPDTTTVTDTDIDHHFGAAPSVDILKLTNGTDNNNPTGPVVAVGSTVTFTYIVTNTGNVPLADVDVTDDQGVIVSGPAAGGDVDGDGLLDVDETWTYTASTLAVADQYVNNGTVVGTPVTETGDPIPGTTTVTDTDIDHHFGAAPDVNILKLTNGTDNNSPTGPVVAVGSTVTFTYIVTNTGNVPLADVDVTDDQGVIVSGPGPGDDVDGDGLLDVNETWTYSASTLAVADQYVNNGTVVGTPVTETGDPIPGTTTVTDTDIDHHFGAAPGVNILKLTNGTDNNSPTGPVVAVGSTVTFTYIVTNTGNVPLADVDVTDDQGVIVSGPAPGGDADGDGLLDVDETWTYTASTLAVADQYVNNGTVVGTPATETGEPIPGTTTVTDTDIDHHFGADPAVAIVKLTNGTDNNSPTGPVVAVGSLVTFTYIVTNTGNVPLADVDVTDDKGVIVSGPAPGGDADGDGLLDVDETWTYTASTLAVPDQYVNNGTVVGTPVTESGDPIPGTTTVTDTDIDHHFGAAPGVSILKLTNGTDNNSPTGPVVAVGSTVTFTYIVTNTGNVPLADVDVTDDQGVIVSGPAPGDDVDGDGLLDVDETWTYTASTLAVADQYVNNGTVVGTPVTETGDPIPGTTTVTDTDIDHHFGADPAVAIVKLTNGTDNNSPTGPVVAVGSTVTFTYIVTNTGNVPLADVDVTDDKGVIVSGPAAGGDADGDGLLDVNETWTYTASTLAVADQYVNNGTVVGTPVTETGDPIPGTTTVTDTDIDHHFGAAPGVNILKLTNGTDNNSPTGPVVAVGSTVTFTYIVTNTGNVPLADVDVTDDQGVIVSGPAPGGDADGDGLLDVDETWTYTASTLAVADQYVNNGTVVGTPVTETGEPIPGTTTVTDTDIDHHFGAAPGVSILKLTNGTDNNSPTGPVVAVGSTVTFTYIVTNTGNVPLADVDVTDDQGVIVSGPAAGDDVDGDGLLDVDETWTYTASTLAVADQYVNNGTVVGTPVTETGEPIPGTTTVTDTDIDHHFGADPAVAIVKLTNGTDNNSPTGPVVAVGSLVTFTYIVTNTGNVPLADVDVTDDKGVIVSGPAPGGDADGDGLLDIDETWTYTASTLAVADQYVNNGTVVGTPVTESGDPIPGTTTVTDTDIDHHFGADPAVAILKLTNGTDNNSPTGPVVAVGSTVTFTYIVTNTGNVPLADVDVTDDQGVIVSGPAPGDDVDGDGLLDVDETWTYTASTLAVADQYVNNGTVVGTPVTETGDPIPGTTTVTDTDIDHHFGAARRVAIVKLTNGTDNNSPTGPVVAVGSTVTFTYIVTNTGNVPLADVDVTDDKGVIVSGPAPGGDADGDGLLDVDETWTYTASTLAVADQYVNNGTVVGTPVTETGDPIPGTTTVTDTDIDHHFGAAPGVNILKLTNGTDNNSPTGPVVAVGSTVTFTYIVTNTGNVPLADVDVTDDQGVIVSGPAPGGDVDGDGLLDVDETWTYTASTLAVADQYVNNGTVVGTPVTETGDPIPGATTVTDTDIDHHFGAAPGVSILKLTNGTDNNSPTGPVVAVGSTVTFTYIVTNTGNVPLADVDVTDDQGVIVSGPAPGGDADGDGLLDVNETWTYTASTLAVAGQYVNNGTVVGTPVTETGVPIPGTTTVTDTDIDHHFGADPAVAIVKLTNGTDNNSPTGPVVAGGQSGDLYLHRHQHGERCLGGRGRDGRQGGDRQRSCAGRRRRWRWSAGRERDVDVHRFHACGGGPIREQRDGRRNASHRDGRPHSGDGDGDRHRHRSPLRCGAGR
jgi:large repetitive protein